MLSAAITASTTGATAVVAAVTGKRIRVVSFVLSFGGTVNAKWQSGSTDKTGLYYGILGSQVSAAPMPQQPGGIPGHFDCDPGEALNINLSGNVAVGGHVAYLIVE